MVEQKKIVEADDGWSPPCDEPGKSSTDAEILRVIDDLKITYPNEIVMHTGISQQTILGRLGYLRNMGVIERVPLGIRPEDDMKARLPGLWDLGLKGKTLKRMSWYRRVKHEAVKK
jgi:DNA-binding transcriptional ArsR family regulator